MFGGTFVWFLGLNYAMFLLLLRNAGNMKKPNGLSGVWLKDSKAWFPRRNC